MKVILLLITVAASTLNAEDLHCIADMELPDPSHISRGVRGRVDVSFALNAEGHPQSMSFQFSGIPDTVNSFPVDKEAEERILERQVRVFLEAAEYLRTCGGETVHLHFIFGVLDDVPPRECWSGNFEGVKHFV